MTASVKAPGSTRYIVRAASESGDASALMQFLDSLKAQTGIRLVDTIGPSAGPPHTAVVETDPQTAEQLRQRTLHQLTIEPDQPLSLSD